MAASPGFRDVLRAPRRYWNPADFNPSANCAPGDVVTFFSAVLANFLLSHWFNAVPVHKMLRKSCVLPQRGCQHRAEPLSAAGEGPQSVHQPAEDSLLGILIAPSSARCLAGRGSSRTLVNSRPYVQVTVKATASYWKETPPYRAASGWWFRSVLRSVLRVTASSSAHFNTENREYERRSDAELRRS